MEQDDIEHELSGGNVAAKVIRLGKTVRKPITESTSSVEAFLQHLSQSGFLHSPHSFGRDDAGRYVLEFIEGETITHPELLTLADLQTVAGVIRDLHRAASSFPPPRSAVWNVAIQPDREELICHNDLGAWNLIRSGSGWVFIDWDGSGPASRLWDLAYAAQSIVHLAYGGDPAKDAIRLRTFVDAYGLEQSEREQFPQLLSRRTRAGYDLLERGALESIEPWARIYKLDNGEYWRKAAEYVREHEAVWASALSSSSHLVYPLTHDERRS